MLKVEQCRIYHHIFFVGIGTLSDIDIDGGKKVKSNKTSQDELLVCY